MYVVYEGDRSQAMGGRHGPWPMALAAQGLVGWAQWAGAKANEGHRRSPLLNQNPTDERKNLREELLLSSVNRGSGLEGCWSPSVRRQLLEKHTCCSI